MSKVNKVTDIYSYMTQMTLPPHTTELYDHKDLFLAQWDQMRASTMPPAVLNAGYEAVWRYNRESEEILLQIQHHWKPSVKEVLMKRLPIERLVCRSRGHSFGSPKLLVNEVAKMEQRYKDWYPIAKEHGLSDSQSEELCNKFCELLLKNMTYEPKHVRKYILDRLDRGAGDGVKWSETLELDGSQWQQILSNICSSIEYIKDNPGEVLEIKYSAGARTRSDELDATGIATGKQEYALKFMRKIAFHLPWSGITLFLPGERKKAVGGGLMSATQELTKGVLVPYYPYVIGGKIYQITSELHLAGYQQTAYDGKGWDGMIYPLLGYAFKPFMIRIGPTIQLPSGIGPTSWLGSVANYIQNGQYQGYMVLNSDDMNYYPEKPGTRIDNVPYIAETIEDTKLKYTLGLSYAETKEPVKVGGPTRPTVIGLKAVKDKREEVQSIGLNDNWSSMAMVGTEDIQNEANVCGHFEGWFGDRTLIEALKNVPGEDFVSPGALFEKVFTVSEKVDAFAWAEREGLKAKFTNRGLV